MTDKKLRQIPHSEYYAKHTDFRGVWTTERTDWPDWPQVRERYMGKRTLFDGRSLQVEGISFEIVPDGKA